MKASAFAQSASRAQRRHHDYRVRATGRIPIGYLGDYRALDDLGHIGRALHRDPGNHCPALA